MLCLTKLIPVLLILCCVVPAARGDELEDLLLQFDRGLGFGDADSSGAADRIVEWGQQNGDADAEARGLVRQAFLRLTPRNEKSGWRDMLDRALKIAGDEKTEVRAEAMLMKAYSLGRADGDRKSIEEVDKAIEFAHEVGADRTLALGYLMAGELERVWGSGSRVRDHNFRGLMFAENVGSPGLIVLALRRVTEGLNYCECYEEGVPYAKRLQELTAGELGWAAANRLLYQAGQFPDYEQYLRDRVARMKQRGSRARVIGKGQIELAGLLMEDSPDEAADLVGEAINTFQKMDDQKWVRLGQLIQAMISKKSDVSTEPYERFQSALTPAHKSQLRWLSAEANIDLAEFYENHGAWREAAEWRKQEMQRLQRYATDSTDNAASSARAFFENSIRMREEQKKISGERVQIQVERDAMAVERSDFAEERERFSRTQLGLMWITGLAIVGAFGTRMVVVSRHRKQLQEEVDRKTASLQSAKHEAETARDRAELADNAKTDFLARMNHELRNPLNAILGYSQLLQHESADIRGHELRGIESSTEHLLQLVNNVLDMSSIESGEIGIDERRFDLHGLCESVDDILRHTAANKGVVFCVEIAPSVPRYVVGDESKLRQLLINLCSNGIKFTSEGQVKLAMSSIDESDDQFRLRALVKDSGDGLSESELGSLFTPYVQSTAAREARSGSGLGLYICKSFADRMGGTLTGRNAKNGGAEFELTVPLKIGAAPLESDTAPGTQDGADVPKVLVVDDNHENLETIARVLQAMGYETRTADSKTPAIQETLSWRPDFVFLDIHMPGADGFEVARAIRDTDAGSDLKIIAITGDAIESVRQRALGSGFDAFLTKPVRLKTIEQAIGELLHS